MQQYEPGIINIRYQAKEAAMQSIFNGKEIFNIDLAKGTVDSASVTFQEIKSNSHLYHSFAMLKQSLPMVMQDEGFSKTISDMDKVLLADPQTSGGLLVAVKNYDAESVLNLFVKEGYDASIIGDVVKKTEYNIFTHS